MDLMFTERTRPISRDADGKVTYETLRYYVCTKDAPYRKEHGDSAVHSDAMETERRTESMRDIITFVCPYCGTTFEEKLTVAESC